MRPTAKGRAGKEMGKEEKRRGDEGKGMGKEGGKMGTEKKGGERKERTGEERSARERRGHPIFSHGLTPVHYIHSMIAEALEPHTPGLFRRGHVTLHFLERRPKSRMVQGHSRPKT